MPGLAAAGPALPNSGRCCVYRVCVLREQNHRSCPLCPSQSPFVRTLTPRGCFQLCFWCLIFYLWAAEHCWGFGARLWCCRTPEHHRGAAHPLGATLCSIPPGSHYTTMPEPLCRREQQEECS